MSVLKLSYVACTPPMEWKEATCGRTFTTDCTFRALHASVAEAAWGFVLLGHASSCCCTSLVACLALKEATVQGSQCLLGIFLWKIRWRVIPVIMCDQSWWPVSVDLIGNNVLPIYIVGANALKHIK